MDNTTKINHHLEELVTISCIWYYHQKVQHSLAPQSDTLETYSYTYSANYFSQLHFLQLQRIVVQCTSSVQLQCI